MTIVLSDESPIYKKNRIPQRNTDDIICIHIANPYLLIPKIAAELLSCTFFVHVLGYFANFDSSSNNTVLGEYNQEPITGAHTFSRGFLAPVKTRSS